MPTTTPPRASVEARPRRRWAEGATAVVPAIVLVAVGWSRRWTTDDAFINYRIVDQLLAGRGPVYNAGERVEVFTSTLWLALLALGDVVLPLPIEYVAIALSLPLCAAGLVAMSIASRRLLAGTHSDGDDDAVMWVPAGTLVLAALPPMWDFSTAGLETGLTLGWTGVLTFALSRVVDAPEEAPAWSLVTAGLAPLVRPDAALAGAAVLLFVLVGTVRAAGWRRARRQLAVAAAVPVAYQLFRMTYFAALVPNTALAKRADVAHWDEGWNYLVDFTVPYALWLPVAGLAVWAAVATRRFPARRRIAVALLPAVAVLHVFFLTRAGGDYMHARLLLPPLFALLAPVATVPVRRSAAAVPAVGLVVWAALTAGVWRVGEPRSVNRTTIGDGREALIGPLGVAHPVTAEDQGWGANTDRARRLRAGPVVVASTAVDVDPPPDLPIPLTAQSAIGVTGYSVGLDVHVLDLLGLADPLTARLRPDRPGFIGHEKPLPQAWLAARISTGPVDQELLPNGGVFVLPLHSSPPERFEADVADARHALACPALRELRDATTARLTPGRAVSNLWRAPGLTRLEVPPDPTEARRSLC